MAHEQKFKEILQQKLTQEDVMELFIAIIDPLADETASKVVSSIFATALRGHNIYTEHYGDIFPEPVHNGEVKKLVMEKIAEHFNLKEQRPYNLVLEEVK